MEFINEILPLISTWLILTVLEIVLGVDNVVFISIINGKLPLEKRQSGINIGLGIALFLRIILLFFLTYLLDLDKPFAQYEGLTFSIKGLILLAGGLFLLYKATTELHDKWYGVDHQSSTKTTPVFYKVILEIALINLVFSFDSILTAVGLTNNIGIMISAVITSTIIMIAFASKIGRFIERYPSFKVLALTFLVMIGVLLIGEGVGKHIEKGYIYVPMAVTVFIEIFNIRMRKNSKGQPPV